MYYNLTTYSFELNKVFEKEIGYGNVALDKSFQFGVRIVNLYKYLISNNQKFETIVKQILRSGTSVGAIRHGGLPKLKMLHQKKTF